MGIEAEGEEEGERDEEYMIEVEKFIYFEILVFIFQDVAAEVEVRGKRI